MLKVEKLTSNPILLGAFNAVLHHTTLFLTLSTPKGLFSTTKSLTTEIAAQMGNATEGGEMKTALWTMALLLFLLSLLFILLIHYFSRPKKDKE